MRLRDSRPIRLRHPEQYRARSDECYRERLLRALSQRAAKLGMQMVPIAQPDWETRCGSTTWEASLAAEDWVVFVSQRRFELRHYEVVVLDFDLYRAQSECLIREVGARL